MTYKHRVIVAYAALVALISLLVGSPVSASSDHSRSYRVTLTDLTHGQPFSPPVAATHHQQLHMFQVGHLATDQLATIAQDGNEAPMFNLFNGAAGVTQAVDVGQPLTPSGRTVGSFTDSVTFDIQARARDRFSIATMLICTNDGFLGLDGVRLPDDGSRTLFLVGWDAGRENNTEKSSDIVDPCSALGPVVLAGDPNGNRDAEVATVPGTVIQLHPGIQGAGDLSPALHGWRDPVAKVTITRLDRDQDDDDEHDD
jgi:Spondin_N